MDFIFQGQFMRKLQSNDSNQNEQISQNEDNINQDLDEAKKIINIIVLVIMGICGFIIALGIFFLIKYIYNRLKRQKLLSQQYQQNGTDSQSVQIDSLNNKNDKNNLQKQQSSDNVSINQEIIKADQTRNQNNTLKELIKDISSSLENQTNLQLELNKLNNLNNIANCSSSQDISKNANKVSTKDFEYFDNQNITQLQNKINQQQEEVLSGQEEANQKKENDSQVFQFENQNTVIMTPSFNNQQKSIFQFRGSERYSFHNTEESNKTLESLKININAGNTKTLSNKKKTLYEYNNQVLQPIQENENKMPSSRFVSRFASEICKNQFMDFNQFSQLTEDQKRQRQFQMKNHLISDATFMFQKQLDKNKPNLAQSKNIPKNDNSNKENNNSDKEKQYPINKYRCLNFPNGLKYMREHVSQVFEEKIE
ncbi:hypothetical protein ABPG72_021233 [Tetrahymena utriculariae]